MTAELALNIFHIGFSSEVDGPGLRMVLYLKGCNLCCPWCAAPESISPAPQVLFYPQRIPEPHHLPLACLFGAVTLDAEGQAQREASRCADCAAMPCARGKSRAFERVGELWPLARVQAKVRRYRPFFQADGGVTIGGGEPTCQFSALHALLTLLKEDGVHLALETNGTHQALPELYPMIDLLYIDLKLADNTSAVRLTGEGIDTVLANIAARQAQGGEMIVRIPVIPGVNSDADTLRAFAQLLHAIGPVSVELLPFHQRGFVKWQALGMQTPCADTPLPDSDMLRRAVELLQEAGVHLIGKHS